MQDVDTAAFQASRIALLMTHIQARLQKDRGKNQWLDVILREEERNNGYSRPVPLVNQATFLAMLYSTALWLRETYFTDEQAISILRKHIRPFVGNNNVIVKYGSGAAQFSGEKSEQFARRLCNALGHASVTIGDDTFVFRDANPHNGKDWVSVEMPWAIVGEYTMALIAAGNELLYGQQGAAADAHKP